MPISALSQLQSTLIGSILNKRKNFSGGLAGLLEEHTKSQLIKTITQARTRQQRRFIPANLAIADRMQSQARMTRAGASNLSGAVNRSSTAGAALNSASQIVNRLGELSALASSSMLTDADRSNLDIEAQSLKQELGDMQSNFSFNGQKILQGGTLSHFTGPDNGNITTTDADLSTVNSDLFSLDLSTQAGASAALTITSAARNSLSMEQVKVGVNINKLQRQEDLAITIATNQENAAETIRVNELGTIGSLFESGSIANAITELFGFKF